jgi:hypothetical protein
MHGMLTPDDAVVMPDKNNCLQVVTAAAAAAAAAAVAAVCRLMMTDPCGSRYCGCT